MASNQAAPPVTGLASHFVGVTTTPFSGAMPGMPTMPSNTLTTSGVPTGLLAAPIRPSGLTTVLNDRVPRFMPPALITTTALQTSAAQPTGELPFTPGVCHHPPEEPIQPMELPWVLGLAVGTLATAVLLVWLFTAFLAI